MNQLRNLWLVSVLTVFLATPQAEAITQQHARMGVFASNMFAMLGLGVSGVSGFALLPVSYDLYLAAQSSGCSSCEVGLLRRHFVVGGISSIVGIVGATSAMANSRCPTVYLHVIGKIAALVTVMASFLPIGLSSWDKWKLDNMYPKNTNATTVEAAIPQVQRVAGVAIFGGVVAALSACAGLLFAMKRFEGWQRIPSAENIWE